MAAADGGFPIALVLVETRKVVEMGRKPWVKCVESGLSPLGVTVSEVVVVKAHSDRIAEQLALLVDRKQFPCVLTVGGTGLHPEDVVPDATLQVIHRFAPGISEAIRRELAADNPEAVLSRGVSGTRGRTLLLNLPDSLEDLERSFKVLRVILPAAVRRLWQPETLHPRQLRLL